jgi:hypothetical protein
VTRALHRAYVHKTQTYEVFVHRMTRRSIEREVVYRESDKPYVETDGLSDPTSHLIKRRNEHV